MLADRLDMVYMDDCSLLWSLAATLAFGSMLLEDFVTESLP
jgi:hypothetical protein